MAIYQQQLFYVFIKVLNGYIVIRFQIHDELVHEGMCAMMFEMNGFEGTRELMTKALDNYPEYRSLNPAPSRKS